MFGWRRKRDGFEWHEYVRTTILVRRAKRRQRVDEVRQAAADGLKDFGVAAAHGLHGAKEKAAAGIRQAGEKGVGGAAVAAAVGGNLLTRSFHAVVAALSGVLRAAGSAGARLAGTIGGPAEMAAVRILAPLADRRVRLAIGAAGVAAGIAAGLRFAAHGADARTILIGGLAAVAMLLVLIVERRRSDVTMRTTAAAPPGGLASILPTPLRRLAPVLGWGAFAAAVVLGLGSLLGPGTTSIGSLVPTSRTAQQPTVSDSATQLSGRAQAISGDTLRISGRFVHLQHIEAPERGQICQRDGGKPWKCGERAKAALSDLVRTGKVQCTLAGPAGNATIEGDCSIGSKDLGEALVREGHVFAQSGLFAQHSALESEARGKKLGIWSGTQQRPAEYRSSVWEEARKAAPEGCPIKGEVSARGRHYVTPWMNGYDRVQVRPSRGGRWFCSEAEALNSGWSPANSS